MHVYEQYGKLYLRYPYLRIFLRAEGATTAALPPSPPRRTCLALHQLRLTLKQELSYHNGMLASYTARH